MWSGPPLRYRSESSSERSNKYRLKTSHQVQVNAKQQKQLFQACKANGANVPRGILLSLHRPVKIRHAAVRALEVSRKKLAPTTGPLRVELQLNAAVLHLR